MENKRLSEVLLQVTDSLVGNTKPGEAVDVHCHRLDTGGWIAKSVRKVRTDGAQEFSTSSRKRLENLSAAIDVEDLLAAVEDELQSEPENRRELISSYTLRREGESRWRYVASTAWHPNGMRPTYPQ